MMCHSDILLSSRCAEHAYLIFSEIAFTMYAGGELVALRRRRYQLWGGGATSSGEGELPALRKGRYQLWGGGVTSSLWGGGVTSSEEEAVPARYGEGALPALGRGR